MPLPTSCPSGGSKDPKSTMHTSSSHCKRAQFAKGLAFSKKKEIQCSI